MQRVQLAVFPGILVSIVVILVVTSLISKPSVVLADNEPGNDPSSSEATIQPDVVREGDNVLAQPSAAGAAPAQKTGAAKNAKKKPSAEPAQNSNTSCGLNGQFSSEVLQWCDLIEKYAGENSLEPALVAALITQESTGNASAYSHSGAVGLMQIMPSDGLAAGFMCISGPCFASRPSSQELLDPEYNISYGTKMLAGLVQKYGDVREALKSYGPMNVGYYYADIVLGIYQNLQ